MSQQQFQTAEIIGKPLARFAQIERATEINDDDRTVELAFSSDQPIYHWFGYLILDHAESSIRLDRLRESGALLWAHDSRLQIGAVESVEVADAKCRALVKFSDSAVGDENFRDVKNKIKRSVSFGFSVHSLDAEVGQDGKQMMIEGEPVYRSRDWEPFEISLVSIPADVSVGVGRSCEESQNFKENASRSVSAHSDFTENKMSKENENLEGQPATEKREQVPNPAAVQNAVITRAADFNAYGEQFGEVELARDLALDDTKTLADLGKAIIEKRAANQKAVPPTPAASIAERQGGQTVELARSNYRGQLKAFRGKDGAENAFRSGHFLRAALHGDEASRKFCREHGITLDRAQSGNNNSTGGILVPTEFENAIIDLRIDYGVFRRNARVVPMSSDTKMQPRRVGGLTAYPVGAGKSGEYSNAGWDAIELVARKWMVLAKYEDEVGEDAYISMADTLASEAAYAFVKAEDEAGFNGDGTGTYHGIVGIIPAINAATASLKTASGNQWSEITEADILGVIGLLPQFARNSGSVKWFCSHTFWATTLQRLALAKGGVTLAEYQGKMKETAFGYPVEIVEVMPTTEANAQIPLLFGNMSQSTTMGDRRGVTVKMTDSNDKDFESDLHAIKATERFDIVNHDVGDTAKAGPVVALKTANS